MVRYFILVGLLQSGKSIFRHNVKDIDIKHKKEGKWDMAEFYVKDEQYPRNYLIDKYKYSGGDILQFNLKKELQKINPSVKYTYIFNIVSLKPKTNIGLFNDFQFVTFIRDPRLCWALCRAFKDKMSIDQCSLFIKEVETFFTFYMKNIKNNRNNLTIYFEDYVLNLQKTTKKIFNHFGFNYTPIDFDMTSSYNKYLSTRDIEREKFCKETQSQEAFDLISVACKDYIKEFGYEENLNLDTVMKKGI